MVVTLSTIGKIIEGVIIHVVLCPVNGIEKLRVGKLADTALFSDSDRRETFGVLVQRYSKKFGLSG
ncbi:hypothetical protein [Desulforhopalus sp. 52FAK]